MPKFKIGDRVVAAYLEPEDMADYLGTLNMHGTVVGILDANIPDPTYHVRLDQAPPGGTGHLLMAYEHELKPE